MKIRSIATTAAFMACAYGLVGAGPASAETALPSPAAAHLQAPADLINGYEIDNNTSDPLTLTNSNAGDPSGQHFDSAPPVTLAPGQRAYVSLVYYFFVPNDGYVEYTDKVTKIVYQLHLGWWRGPLDYSDCSPPGGPTPGSGGCYYMAPDEDGNVQFWLN